MTDYQLLAPEETGEEQYPYRRVWRALITELGLLLLVVVVVLVGDAFGFVEDVYSQTTDLALVALPVFFFLIISYRQERQALEPRDGLLSILVLSFVIANGVAFPVIDAIFTPDTWLPEAGFFERVFGYTLTLGVLSEFIKYAAVRYTVWPNRFRTRMDGIAYSAAAAVGYATVFNLRYALLDEPTVTATAMRVMTNIFVHVAIAAIMGYFLSELALGNPSAYWLPLGLIIAAFISGLHTAFRALSIVSGLDPNSTASRPVGGVLLAVGLAIAILGALSFLIENAETRAAEQLGVLRPR